ncbi:hypothetical protein HPB47_011733 [Ixodes persulcatus]|uniref:Uncharacterized protein n=1 Tax=Ixodes persulcatus TaxID=34615 RepID=A0AC60NVP9_IXOPE|nr:hypothetical protein HPB47_011733 [Ixodes persulcatus]
MSAGPGVLDILPSGFVLRSLSEVTTRCSTLYPGLYKQSSHPYEGPQCSPIPSPRGPNEERTETRSSRRNLGLPPELGSLPDRTKKLPKPTMNTTSQPDGTPPTSIVYRLPGVAAISTSSCNSPDLREIIRDVVREEIRKLLPAATSPVTPSVAEIVREELQQALQPEVLTSAAPEPPKLSYAAATRRPPPPAHPFTAPPRRDLPEPQTFRRQEGQPQLVRTEQPAHRKTDVWRTADQRPLCYHCGEADHVYRRCPYRQMGLRGFAPSDPRPRLGERPRDIEEYLRRPLSPVPAVHPEVPVRLRLDMIPVEGSKARRMKSSLTTIFVAAATVVFFVTAATSHFESGASAVLNSSHQLGNVTETAHVHWLLRQSMDLTKHPCENFYGYVCGRYHLTQVEPLSELVAQNVSSRIRDEFFKFKPTSDNNSANGKAMAFFSSCLSRVDETQKDKNRDDLASFMKNNRLTFDTKNARDWKLGFAAGLSSWNGIDRYYSRYPVPRGSFLDAYLATSQAYARQQLTLRPYRFSDFANADLESDKPSVFYGGPNTISIAAAAMVSTFFDVSEQSALNFGVLGSIVTRQLMRAFHHENRRYDDQGYLFTWSEPEEMKFMNRWNCRQNMRPGLPYDDAEPTVSIGAHALFRAYKKAAAGRFDVASGGFNSDQMFFVSRCYVYCGYRHIDTPHECAVLAQDSPEFAKAFNCPKGSPMNPENKCDLW